MNHVLERLPVCRPVRALPLSVLRVALPEASTRKLTNKLTNQMDRSPIAHGMWYVADILNTVPVPGIMYLYRSRAMKDER